ncbi:hypothetical protein NE237_024158 [Protea cynaroides]|uniref:Jacalin-type lectin domain-containing protein n=1 Tax=Protea cynaroides TaxID=273540 RepID=A0A9Q0K559_9MAGN|nr:hypothetical protein NE237_024158 [Protea cynaroides]
MDTTILWLKVDSNGCKEGTGIPWDDKGQSMLTHIFISYESTYIKSIQTSYISDGRRKFSSRHGSNGAMFSMAELDCPSEFLTGISGYKDVNGVNSLTFETNRRKIGPFGQEKGKHFSIQMGSNFGGFHGESFLDYLCSIGVYLKTMDPMLKNSGDI